MKLDLKTRAYIYRIFTALSLLAGGYGLVSDAKAALWAGVVAAVLGNGLAVANTQAPKTRNDDGAVTVATACLVVIAAVMLLGWFGVHGHAG